ncbi:hypothetical protein ACS0TY_013818 [Phlomoides rotata]
MYFEDRAILSPMEVECINERVLSMISGDTREYLSSDSVADWSLDWEVIEIFWTPRSLLVLKEGVSIMLLRNINQKSDLCNGTRLIVTKF